MGYEGKSVEARAELGDDLWELHSGAARIAEFTAGRTLEEYRESEVLRAVVESMLGVMEAAAARISRRSAETAARMEGLAELERLTGRPDAEVWRFVEETLPQLLSSVGAELESWHAG